MKKLLLLFGLTLMSNFSTNAQVVLNLPATGFTATGAQFSTVAEGTIDVTGSLTSITFNTALTASVNETFANDLTVIVTSTNAINSTLLLQVGGFSNFGATERGQIADGDSEVIGTTCSETYTLTTPLSFSSPSTLTIWIGNGWAGSVANPSSGTWTGSVTLNGVNEVLSTKEFSATKLLVYPNPSTDIINISNTLNAVVNTVEITDLNGRTVKTQNVNNTEAQISISDLSAGVYMLKVSTDQGTATKKIVKQ